MSDMTSWEACSTWWVSEIRGYHYWGPWGPYSKGGNDIINILLLLTIISSIRISTSISIGIGISISIAIIIIIITIITTAIQISLGCTLTCVNPPPPPHLGGFNGPPSGVGEPNHLPPWLHLGG